MKKRQTQKQSLPVINPDAAGIDIGATFHVVAVSPERSEEPVQTFQSFTTDIHRMADWLVRLGITTVAMESTGVYWVLVYEELESRGLRVILANARETRSVPGRKTNVNSVRFCLTSIFFINHARRY